MNPFLHPAVATPLPDEERSHWNRATLPAPPAVVPGRGTQSRQAAESAAGRQATATPGWSHRLASLAVAVGIGLGVNLPAQAQRPQVNANIASAMELQSIKGIGPKTAQTIVQERERSGPFESFQDLAERIRGIGPKRAQTLRAAGLTVSGGGGDHLLPPGRP